MLVCLLARLSLIDPLAPMFVCLSIHAPCCLFIWPIYWLWAHLFSFYLIVYLSSPWPWVPICAPVCPIFSIARSSSCTFFCLFSHSYCVRRYLHAPSLCFFIYPFICLFIRPFTPSPASFFRYLMSIFSSLSQILLAAVGTLQIGAL